MTKLHQMGFRALADPTRRSILILLSKQDMSIGEVAENFDMTRAAVKKHLTILNEGGLINITPQGRSMRNALNPDGLKHLVDWFSYFDAFWDDKLAALKTEIEKDIQ